MRLTDRRFIVPRRILTIVLSLWLAACSEAAAPDDAREPDDIDLDALFAPPTSVEIATIRSEWDRRRISVQAVREESSGAFLLGFVQAQLRIVSHVVDGVRHYGAIVRPDGAGSRKLAVLVYAHGGDNGFSVDELALLAAGLGDAADDFVLVAPSFRSEEIRYDGRRWQSEGAASPWDHDVDDALALARIAFQTEPAADSTRVGVVGLSRGGNVAMLMGVRDPQVDVVVEFFGPTDFFGEFVREVTVQTLRGTPPDLPGLAYLASHVIEPLRRGDIPMAAAREEMVRRSAAYFAPGIARLQVHHGTADPIVPVSQAHSLDREMRAAGRGSPSYSFHIYNGGDHNPLTLSGSIERTVAFLGFIAGPAVSDKGILGDENATPSSSARGYRRWEPRP
jgi:dipeptidyl aminopeptidase/acylaminoacyl peptidase